MAAQAAVLLLASVSVFEPAQAWWPGSLVSEFASGALESVEYAAAAAAHPLDLAKKVLRDAKDFARMPDKSKGPQKNYTWAEVARCDGEGGRQLFIVLDRNVYDISDFADLHPAGPRPLKRYAGRDAGAAMRATRMPPRVYDTLMVFFKVGQIATTEAEGSFEASNP